MAQNINLSSWQDIRLLTINEVARWVRVHPKTVYRWIEDKKIKALVVGKRTYRIPESEIIRILVDLGAVHLIRDYQSMLEEVTESNGGTHDKP